MSKQIQATFVSVWDNGMTIPTAAIFDEDTGIVSDIQQANLPVSILESLDILTDHYVLVGEKKYELQENGDGTFTVLRNYGVFFTRGGYAEIKAVTADEAMRIADETMKVDDVSWDEDWHPTDAQLEE